MKYIKKTVTLIALSLSITLVAPEFLPYIISTTTVEAASVKISKTKATLIKGQTLTLKITGTKSKVKWSSSKKSVATVNNKGVVKAKKTGTTNITAKIGKKSLKCKINVETPSISKKSISLNTGETYTLKMNGIKQKVKWSSSNKSIASVSSTGKITAKKKGTAIITAKIGVKKYNCKITVKENKSIFNISLNYSSLELKEGYSETLIANIYPNYPTSKPIFWQSSNTKVATVSNGLVTGIAPGTSIITATCDGQTATCTVNVTIDFNVTNAENSIQYTVQKYYGIFFLKIKNTYKYPVDITAYATYYKNGGAVTTTYDRNYYLECNKEGILVTNNNFSNDYDDYEVKIVVNGIGKKEYDTSGISCNVTNSQTGTDVDLKNTSPETYDSTYVSCTYLKNGLPIYHYSYKIYIKNIGSESSVKFTFPFDSNNNVIMPDTIIVCLNGAIVYNNNL